jgi:hypothetical protein
MISNGLTPRLCICKAFRLRNEGWTCFALISLILHLTILILITLHTASVCTLSSTCDTWNVRLGCLAGCKNCANTAPDTFAIEEDFGRARVVSQSGNPAQAQSAIETWFWASLQPFYMCWDFCFWRVEIMVIRSHLHCMRNTASDLFKDSPGMQHAKHSGCWQGVSESCSPVDCIHRVTAAQLTLLEDEMRRIERVNVCPLFLTLPVRNSLNILVACSNILAWDPDTSWNSRTVRMLLAYFSMSLMQDPRFSFGNSFQGQVCWYIDLLD